MNWDFSEAVEAAGPGIVRVEARHGIFSSGVVWSPDVVVTASHAVDREEEIEVGFGDGTTRPATLAGRDPQTDLAVLKVEGANLQAPKWIEVEGLKVGHWALALARPGKTVRASLGIVSAFGPSWRSPAGGKIDFYLESDTRLLPGFSGGALVNSRGEALGITTSGLLRRHSLAVPKSTVNRVVESLLTHGRIRRGFLGINVHPVRLPEGLEKEAGQPFGALVLSVLPGSGAERGGLLQGDVLLALDGQPVRHPGDLWAILDEDRVGAETVARLARAGKVQDIRLTVGTRP